MALTNLCALQGEWESFLDLYGAGAPVPDSPNAELMLAASLHQWRKVVAILQRLVNERRAADDAASIDLSGFQINSDAAPAASAGAAPAPAASSRLNSLRRSAPDDAGLDNAAAAAAAKRACSPQDVARAAEARANGASSSAAAGAAASPARRRGTPRQLAATSRLSGSGGEATAHTASGDLPATGSAVQAPQRSRVQPSAALADGASAAPPPSAPLDGASLTWLITQLMHTAEPGAPSQHMGQPCQSMRNQILLLLRPMMNFQEKVVYFQDEQDRILDYHLAEFGDDDTMHIEVRRGDEVLGDTVEQMGQWAEESMLRELTVAFRGEDGEDGGGLLKEFCQVRLAS